MAQPDIGAYELPAPPTVEPPPPPANTRPKLGKVSMTNKVFAPEEAHAAAATAADRNRARDRDRARARVKRGTIFRYLLSESATVTIAIERRARGRRARTRARGVGRCVKPKKQHGKVKGKPCIRWLRAGALKSVERAGSQGTPFSGRFKGRALKPGRYRARVVAKDRAGARSRESRVTFKIVRAR